MFFTGIRALALIARFFIHTSMSNYGIAFGLPAHSALISIVLLLAIVCLATILHYRPSNKLILPITLILAGGASNILDRVIYGAVIDPIVFFNWQGNVADIAIFIGIIWSLWGTMKERNIKQPHASTHKISSSIRNRRTVC